ncbi:MAG: hypothetical protein RI894_1552, partial [Bacteroidota bacterium]
MRHLILVFFLLWGMAIFPQKSVAFVPPVPEDKTLSEPNNRSISDVDWQKAKAGIDYSHSAAEAEAKRKAAEASERNGKKRSDAQSHSLPNFSPSFFEGMSVLVKSIFIGLIIGLIALLLYLVSKSALFLGNATVNTEIISLEDVENDLHESDLERFLRQALENGDYRLALRIYYLMILKALSLKELIAWKKDKTNNEYCRELR